MYDANKSVEKKCPVPSRSFVLGFPTTQGSREQTMSTKKKKRIIYNFVDILMTFFFYSNELTSEKKVKNYFVLGLSKSGFLDCRSRFVQLDRKSHVGLKFITRSGAYPGELRGPKLPLKRFRKTTNLSLKSVVFIGMLAETNNVF